MMADAPSLPNPNSVLLNQGKLEFIHEDKISPIEQNRSTSETKKPSKITFLEPNVDVLSKSQKSSSILSDRVKLYKRPSFSDSKVYLLDVVEQPQQCRMSGLGEKDRRPIDPAPIVKLTAINCFDNGNAKDEDGEDADELESSFYVLHTSLWSEDMQTQFDLIEGVYPYTVRFLVGSLVSSPSILHNLQDEQGIYFAFPDLSVRMTGTYRLRFSLIHLAMNTVVTEVFSDAFLVYPAKSYPGMKESSSLSKHLAKQGLKLTVRTQTRGKKDNQ